MTELVADPDPPEVASLLLAFSGKLAFDVGANVGQSAKVLSPRFERVVSFEPAVESYEFLADVAKTLDNVTAVQVAVTAMDGPIVLNVQDRHIAKGQLTSSNACGHDWGTIIGRRQVEGVRLDMLAEEFGVPDLIKVDVEGHDALVVLGGLKTIVTHAPDLYIEVHNDDLGWLLRRMLVPVYGTHLRTVRHPHYPPGSWGERNHYWLVTG